MNVEEAEEPLISLERLARNCAPGLKLLELIGPFESVPLEFLLDGLSLGSMKGELYSRIPSSFTSDHLLAELKQLGMIGFTHPPSPTPLRVPESFPWSLRELYIENYVTESADVLVPMLASSQNTLTTFSYQQYHAPGFISGLDKVSQILPQLPLLEYIQVANMWDAEELLTPVIIASCPSLAELRLGDESHQNGGMSKILPVVKALPASIRLVQLQWGEERFEETEKEARQFGFLLDQLPLAVTLELSEAFKLATNLYLPLVEKFEARGGKVVWCGLN